MKSNRLQLNSSKTEVMWCATSRRQHLQPASALSVDGVMVDPVTSVRDLDIYIDTDLSIRTHVQQTMSCCFAVLRQLRQIFIPIKFCMGLHHVTWVRSSVCLICLVGVVSALPAPIAWSCRHSNCLLLAAEHLMLLLLEHGTVCRRM